MAFRDTWHSALVYFGLAEERGRRDADDVVDEPDVDHEQELRETYRERPNVRRLQRTRRRGEEDFDDIFSDDVPSRSGRGSRALGGSSNRPTRVLQSVSNGNGDVRVHLVIPKSFNDAQQVADKFKDGIPVILNMQDSERELIVRLIDFTSGLAYALDGGMQRITEKVFMLTPRNVEISAEERERLMEKGFFNQS